MLLNYTTINVLIVSDMQAKSEKCLWNKLGYKQKTWGAQNTDLNKGTLRSISFIKKQKSTGLRILYSANIRELKSQRQASWSIRIDGYECSKPSRISISQYHYRQNNLHLPAVLLGTCTATSRGVIGKGNHVVSVHITSVDGFSGWVSSCFLEIREICLENQ